MEYILVVFSLLVVIGEGFHSPVVEAFTGRRKGEEEEDQASPRVVRQSNENRKCFCECHPPGVSGLPLFVVPLPDLRA